MKRQAAEHAESLKLHLEMRSLRACIGHSAGIEGDTRTCDLLGPARDFVGKGAIRVEAKSESLLSVGSGRGRKVRAPRQHV